MTPTGVPFVTPAYYILALTKGSPILNSYKTLKGFHFSFFRQLIHSRQIVFKQINL